MAAKHLSPGERSDPGRVVLPPYYPDTLLARRTLARYYDCVTVMDKVVGNILQELTDDDYQELLGVREWGVYLIEAVEAKLKEKNSA